MKNTKKLENQRINFGGNHKVIIMEDKKMIIGQGLKSLRLDRNYTQEFVASVLGNADGTSVYRLESGKVDLKLEDAMKLAELYDVSVDRIYNPKRTKEEELSDNPRSSYGLRNQIHLSIILDGTPKNLQKQIEMLTKVNAALAGE